MNIEIRDSSLQGRIQKQLELTGSVEELLGCLLERQEEQDRRLQENREAIDGKIRRGIAQLERGEGVPEDPLEVRLKGLEAKSQ